MIRTRASLSPSLIFSTLSVLYLFCFLALSDSCRGVFLRHYSTLQYRPLIQHSNGEGGNREIKGYGV